MMATEQTPVGALDTGFLAVRAHAEQRQRPAVGRLADRRLRRFGTSARLRLTAHLLDAGRIHLQPARPEQQQLVLARPLPAIRPDHPPAGPQQAPRLFRLTAQTAQRPAERLTPQLAARE